METIQTIHWEIWKEVKWWEDSYEVSNFWRVLSLPKEVNLPNWAVWILNERILTIAFTQKVVGKKISNTWSVWFSLDWKTYRRSVWRLVAEAFLWMDYEDETVQVMYKDQDVKNLHVSNIEIVTIQEKQIRSYNRWSKKQSPVLQYSRDWKLIWEFKNMHDAMRQTGVQETWISICCRKVHWHKTAWGFIWKYKEK